MSRRRDQPITTGWRCVIKCSDGHAVVPKLATLSYEDRGGVTVSAGGRGIVRRGAIVGELPSAAGVVRETGPDGKTKNRFICPQCSRNVPVSWTTLKRLVEELRADGVSTLELSVLEARVKS